MSAAHDLLLKLVAIKSLSRQETEIADFLERYLREAGCDVQRDANNLWCEIGDCPRPRLLLNSHIDTVPPGEGWTADPWTPRCDNGRITALGANDAKGCVAAMTTAFLAIKNEIRGNGLGGSLILALTAEEEISGNGLSEVRPRIEPLDAALVGEPTSLTPMTTQRGLLILRATAHGRSSHPANTPADTPHNAIMNAVADLETVRKFHWGPAHPLLGRAHGHVTLINGGVARNVIPDKCEFWLDIRTTPAESHAALVARVGAALRSEIAIHSDRLEPIHTDAKEAIVRAVVAALPAAKPAGSPAMSDMVFLRGIPSVKIGPGDTARSHTPDEYLLETELEAGVTAYHRIVRNYFESAPAVV